MYGYINKETKKDNVSTYYDVNRMLDTEKSKRSLKWSKLVSQEKVSKLNEYILSSNYTQSQKQLLKIYIKNCINRKKLIKDKDVVYNVKTEKVESINNLTYDDVGKRFTISKHKSTTTKKNKLKIKNQ